VHETGAERSVAGYSLGVRDLFGGQLLIAHNMVLEVDGFTNRPVGDTLLVANLEATQFSQEGLYQFD
jgi:hypothetical protein